MILLCLALVSGAIAAQYETPCSNASAVCQANSTCNALWQSWRSTCADVIAGLTISCTASCNASFDALLQNDIGMCHCNATNASCETERVNVLAACRGVAPPPAAKCQSTLEPDRPSMTGCRSLSDTCKADSTCRVLLERHHAACAGAFANRICTTNCKNRLQDLRCDPIGRAIYASRNRCVCSRGDVACFTRSTYVDNLCFDTQYPHVPPGIQDCDYVTSTCELDRSCAPLFSNFLSKCARELNGTARLCDDACKQAAFRLFSHPIGWRFMKCSCPERDQECGVETAYLLRTCYNMVSPAPHPCSYIQSWCSNDVRCKDIGKKYSADCRNVSSCVEPCRTAVSGIIYNPIGATLLNCFCERSDDDDDELECRQYRNITLSCRFDPLMPPSTAEPPSTSSPVDTRRPLPTGGTGSLGISLAIFVSVLLIVCLLV